MCTCGSFPGKKNRNEDTLHAIIGVSSFSPKNELTPFPRRHLADSVISVDRPPFSSIVSGLVCSFALEGFGCPCRTYRPGGTSSNAIWFLASIFPDPPHVPTADPPSGSMFTMYPGGRFLPVKSTVTRTRADFIMLSLTSFVRRRDRLAQARAAIAGLVQPDRGLSDRNLIRTEAAVGVGLARISCGDS